MTNRFMSSHQAQEQFGMLQSYLSTEGPVSERLFDTGMGDTKASGRKKQGKAKIREQKDKARAQIDQFYNAFAAASTQSRND